MPFYRQSQAPYSLGQFLKFFCYIYIITRFDWYIQTEVENKWRYFIWSHYIHHGIALFLLKSVYFYNLCINLCNWIFRMWPIAFVIRHPLSVNIYWTMQSLPNLACSICRARKWENCKFHDPHSKGRSLYR